MARSLQQLDIVDHQQVEPALALEPARAGGELRDRETAGLVDVERHRLHLARDLRDAVEVGRVDLAAQDAVRGNLRLFRDDAVGELRRRHFEREESHDAAIDAFGASVGAHFAAPGARDVVGEVGGKRSFPHARTAGEDDQVGRLQPAHHAVDVHQSGREAGQLAVALIGPRRHVDRGGQCGREALEAAVIAAGLGELVEPPLGILDLVARREIDRRVIGDIDHVLADDDQRAPDGEIVDGASVVLGVDHRRRLGGEPREVLARGQPGDVEIGRQERLQRHGARDLAGADQARAELEDLGMDRLEEVLRLEEVGDAVERLVVDQDRAQQRLFRLDVVRGGTKDRRVVGRGPPRRLIDGHFDERTRVHTGLAS